MVLDKQKFLLTSKEFKQGFFAIGFILVTLVFFLNETVQNYLEPIGWHTWLESVNFEVYNFYFNAFVKEEDRYMLAFVWSLPILTVFILAFIYLDAYKTKRFQKENILNEKQSFLFSIWSLVLISGFILFGLTFTPLRPIFIDQYLSIQGFNEFLIMQVLLSSLIYLFIYWFLHLYSLFISLFYDK